MTEENDKQLKLIKIVADPNDPSVKTIAESIEFYSNNFSVPAEVLDALVCQAYLLGETDAIKAAMAKINAGMQGEKKT